MTKITKSLAVLAVGGLMCAGTAAAQPDNTCGAGAGQVDPGHPRVNQINQREQNQQDRIADGEKNDKLTPGQAANLEKGSTAPGEQRKGGHGQGQRPSYQAGSEAAEPRSEPPEPENPQRQAFR
jgi:hypothetical protein